jgi:primase-polymerase (primpol)-like protein
MQRDKYTTNVVDIPHTLRTPKQWVFWRYQERDGKKTKVPYQPDAHRLRLARTNDPVTWGSFEDALRACAAHGGEGLGFVFAKGGGIVGVDLDWKAWPSEGIPGEAVAIVGRLPSYAEYSPSGRGVHILLRGKLPPSVGHKRVLAPGVELEVYEHTRFFTVTGQHYQGSPQELRDCQAELESLCAELFTSAAAPPIPTVVRQVDLGDSELLERMFAARNGREVKQLWDGDAGQYGGDRSRADLALAGHLMFWCGGDTARADRLFRQSGLYRQKWDERHFADGRTYGQATLERARSAGTHTRSSAQNYRGGVYARLRGWG